MSQVAEKGCEVRVVSDDEQYNPICVTGAKIVYSMRNMSLHRARDIWPKRLDIPEDAQVAIGEHYVHGDWFSIRTSLIIGIDHVKGVVETRNSFYRSIDGRLN